MTKYWMIVAGQFRITEQGNSPILKMDIYVQMVMFNRLGSSFSLWEIAEQRKIPLFKNWR